MEAGRLLLLGAIGALLLRVAWGVTRSAEDRVTRIAVVWAGFVCVLIGAQVALARLSASGAGVVWLVRLMYFAALAPIPLLLRTLSVAAGPAARRKARAPVLVTALAALLVWMNGPVLADPPVLRITGAGHHWALTPGPLLPVLGVVALAAWLYALRIVRLGGGVDKDDTYRLVFVGGGLLAVAGANDTLIDAGVIRTVPLVDAACFATLVLVGAVLARRTRVAFGGAQVRIEEQTRELDRHHAALAVRERRVALGALSAGLGHEINNPLAVVSLDVERALELLGEIGDLPGVQGALRAARSDCRAVASAIGEFERRSHQAQPTDEPAEGARISRAPASGRRRVLIVDDEPAVARSLARALRAHEVTLAHSGAEAVDAMRQHHFDSVLCDVMMPGMSGPELHAALVAEGLLGSAAFAFVTGGAFSRDVADAVARVSVPVLRKPIDMDALLEALAPELDAAKRGGGA